MKSIHYLGLIVRLFAIALFAFGVKNATFFLETLFYYSEDAVRSTTLFMALSALAPLIISVVLWFFPMTAASKIMTDKEASVEVLSSVQLLSIIIVGIGFYTLYYALVDAVFWLSFKNMASNGMASTINGFDSSPQDKANMIATAVAFLLSLILIFKSKTIATFISRTVR
ncbi:hypothetical protein [Pleionea mediterranea]|uniref:Uncharacterized protein n=1 Tax=Pleionea mediterranea TaxID=523701 RepID=A0A316FE98_9GAMM|nr:hypothetical protein [Pleionea mediterranea]PWK45370.1 hypothetical protein C8D97_11443 [Pleionea mediterranea]